jgi:hypothetical protein
MLARSVPHGTLRETIAKFRWPAVQRTPRGAAQLVYVIINGIPSHRSVRCFRRVAASVAGIFDDVND